MKLNFTCKAHCAMRYGAGLLIAILTSIPTCLLAQNPQTVKGTILSAQNSLPLADVNVAIKGTGKGTKTGANGEYSISANASDIIVFSFTGFTTHEEKVGNRTVINFTLEVSTSKLDEVVVIGYGTSKRKDLTGAVSSVSGKELA